MTKRVRSSRANEKAYALISILVIGSFAMMFLLGLATTFLTIVRSEGVHHEKSKLLDATESGLDFAIDVLNRAPPTNNTDIVIYDENTSNFPIFDSGISVKVRVTPLQAGGINWTSVSEFSVLQPFPLTPILPNGVSQSSKTEYWRLVEITAKKGLF